LARVVLDDRRKAEQLVADPAVDRRREPPEHVLATASMPNRLAALPKPTSQSCRRAVG
jgi:hypothetical protein